MQRVFFAPDAPPLDNTRPHLNIYVGDLLGADSCYISYGDMSMLLDCGKKNQASQVLDMLNMLGVSNVTYAFNSHPHDDHIDGFQTVLAQIGCEMFLTPYALDDRQEGSHQRIAVKRLNELNIPITVLENHAHIPFGDVRVQMFRNEKATTLNSNSALLYITLENTSILFTADINQQTPLIIARNYEIDADIMKYPHHGLENVPLEFMNAVSPEFCYIPHGRVDSVNGQKLLDRLHIPYLFATRGIIHMETDGNIWVVQQLPKN